MRQILVLFCSILMGIVSPTDDCKCKKVENKETTHLAGKEWFQILYDFRVKVVQGSVAAPTNEPLSDVLVELYALPDRKLVSYNSIEERLGRIAALKRKRVMACKTNGDGAFCLGNLQPADYELRISKKGFKPTYSIVTVVSNEKDASDFNILIQMIPIDKPTSQPNNSFNRSANNIAFMRKT